MITEGPLWFYAGAMGSKAALLPQQSIRLFIWAGDPNEDEVSGSKKGTVRPDVIKMPDAIRNEEVSKDERDNCNNQKG